MKFNLTPNLLEGSHENRFPEGAHAKPHEDPYIFLGPFSNSPLAKFFERRNCNLRIQGLSERIQGFRFATDNVHETDKKEGGVAQIYQKYCWGVSILDGVEKEEEGGESN